MYYELSNRNENTTNEYSLQLLNLFLFSQS